LAIKKKRTAATSRTAPAPRRPTWPATARSGTRTSTFDAPHSREAETPLAEGEKHDQLAEKVECSENRQEALLDEGLEESFPGSDPVSVKRIT
jgi:hypothetical protein